MDKLPNILSTGFSQLKSRNDDIDYIEELSSFIALSIESSVEYSETSGRDNLSGQDLIYGLMYQAHEFSFGDRPISEDSTDEGYSTSESSFSDDDGDEFTRPSPAQSSHKSEKMNYYHDTWTSWTPVDEFRVIIKNAVDECLKTL
jgi:hypothetical protein